MRYAGLEPYRPFGIPVFRPKRVYQFRQYRGYLSSRRLSATGFNIGNYVLTVNPPRYVSFLSDNPRLYLVSSPDSAVRMHDLEVRHCTIHTPTAKSFLYFLTVGIECNYHKVTIHIITSFVLVVGIRNRFFVVIDGIIFAFWTFPAFYQLVIDIRIIGDHSLQFGISVRTFHVQPPLLDKHFPFGYTI